MSDNTLHKIPAPRDSARGERTTWPVVTGRCHPDDMYLIDRAALELGQKRSYFVVAAALAQAREVLATGPRAA